MRFIIKKKSWNKKAMGLDYLSWLIIGLIILAIGVVVISILSGKGIGALDFIKDKLLGV